MNTTTPVALVTGSSRGIGRGIAFSLAAAGFSVAINYAGNEKAARETETECRRIAADRAEGAARGANEQRFAIFQADIGSRDDRHRMVSQVLSTFGRIDALVNNAGIAPTVRADIVDASEESFARLMEVNLQGPYFLSQAVVRYWLGLDGQEKPEPALRGGFKLVFISSISAATASVSRGEYCVSKAGIAMASQLWAARLADSGVQVYEVRPGIMATDMTAGVKEKYDALIAEGLVPQRRWGTPEDVGTAVEALVRGDFPFSTGEVIYTDGGFHISRL
jgi:NAD(P)-dependent dehydrogenase (short-subunit alcohol dehydrogenase family)